MSNYVDENGIVFTDADIGQWVEEADAGFPNSVFVATPGRPWETHTEPMVTKSLRVPNSLWSLLEKQAKEQGISTSELARQALAQGLLAST